MIREKSKRLLRLASSMKYVLFFQIFTDLVILLDVGVVRQIVAFVYLTFIPGIVVVKIFKWDREGTSTTILLSVGLSIALLMFVGFAINELVPLMGVATPLSIVPLLATMNLFVVLGCIQGFVRRVEFSTPERVVPRSLLFLVFLPLLSVLGAFAVNVSGDPTILYFMIIAVSLLTVVVVVRRAFLPANYFPWVLLGLAVTLVFHTSLVTNYIVGWDVHSEYNVFKMTESANRWNVGLRSWDDRIGKGNAMLSTTVLPTIYAQLLSIDGTWVFKIVYPLIAVFLPFVLFQMYSPQQGGKAAFLSVFFLMSSPWFFSADAFAVKQIVAQLFFALLFLVILKERAGTFKREFLFTILGFGLVVSHYSMSYIFLFLISLAWFLQNVLRRAQESSVATLSEILLFFTMSFGWYIYTSAAAPFDAILNTTNHVFSTLVTDFFNPAARTTTVLAGLGAGQVASLGHQIGRVFFYITEFFIVIGFIKLILRRRNTKFSPEFTLLSSFSMVMLGLAVVLPNLAGTFRMERFYQISLVFLAAVCTLGGETVLEFLLKRKNHSITIALLLLVLVPNFLFQVGFLYSITEDVTYSLPFSLSKTIRPPGIDRLIIYQQEVSGAEWLRTNTHQPIVYADYFAAFHVLTSYGALSTENLELLSEFPDAAGSEWYTYLRQENVKKGIMVAEDMNGDLNPLNINNISLWLNAQNLVYSNGGCEILSGKDTSANATETSDTA